MGASVQWGVWRYTAFPPHPQEELIAIWLWSGQEGIFSHETALYLHDLLDALPTVYVLTLPLTW